MVRCGDLVIEVGRLDGIRGHFYLRNLTGFQVDLKIRIEDMVLCLMGGGVGILLGHGESRLVELLLRWPVETSPAAIAAAVIVSASVGIIFGFYPAWKASRLDHIEALRYE